MVFNEPLDDPFVVGEYTSTEDSAQDPESPRSPRSSPPMPTRKTSAFQPKSPRHDSATDPTEDFDYPEPAWAKPPTPLTEQSYPSLETRVDFLRRLILHILTFTYDADIENVPSPSEGKTSTQATRLITGAELDKAVYLAHSIVYCISTLRPGPYNIYNPIRNQPLDWEVQNSLEYNYAVVFVNVVLPAVELSVAPEWVFEQLFAYYTHRCAEGKEEATMLFHDMEAATSDDGSLKRDRDKVRPLAKRVIADGLVIEKLRGKKGTGLEEVGKQIAMAIEMFSEESMGNARDAFEGVERKMWYGKGAKRLAVAIRKMMQLDDEC